MSKEVEYMGGGYFNPQIRRGGMFRRRTSSPGKIHYRVNINKNCLGFVDIYIDRKPYQSGFNGSYLDIYRDKKIKTISISGQISYLNPKNEYIFWA